MKNYIPTFVGGKPSAGPLIKDLTKRNRIEVVAIPEETQSFVDDGGLF